MTQAIAPRNDSDIIERVMIEGDLSKLQPVERASYYKQVCESLGLNPFTRPFEYLELDGKLALYARRDATDQLRKLHGVNVVRLERERMDDLYVVTVYATDRNGRQDSAIGAVPLMKEDGEWKTAQSGKRYFSGNGKFSPLTGDALANAIMKAETKAKRRVTLSLCGLGWTDESEVEAIPNAQTIVVDHETGEMQTAEAERDQAIHAWVEASEEAVRLAIVHKDLPSNASVDQIKRWTKALEAKIYEAQAAA